MHCHLSNSQSKEIDINIRIFLYESWQNQIEWSVGPQLATKKKNSSLKLSKHCLSPTRLFSRMVYVDQLRRPTANQRDSSSVTGMQIILISKSKRYHRRVNFPPLFLHLVRLWIDWLNRVTCTCGKLFQSIATYCFTTIGVANTHHFFWSPANTIEGNISNS